MPACRRGLASWVPYLVLSIYVVVSWSFCRLWKSWRYTDGGSEMDGKSQLMWKRRETESVRNCVMVKYPHMHSSFLV
ncbi:hypothetical protein FB567DRAFT_76930 [Paraphoma chrysanthemicola]|uniref:Uncharacterized protein n=1 Tax=Paraphoma chrysanthemicola TaxID=798071 RepID=A0A8K0VWM3_9PLEO|nr:hypothetical protein FB567DRAFT_76930 [Paraphoma chrysanthemicola]